MFLPSSRRLLTTGGLWLVLMSATASSQTPRPLDPAQARPQQPLPFLPLTQLDERAPSAELDNRTVTLTITQPVPVRDALQTLARTTNISIVTDPSITGVFAGELKNVTVRQGLDLILEPQGLAYTVDGSFVRVFRREPDTRIFDINYIATDRTATARVGIDNGATNASVSTSVRTDVFADLSSGVRALVSERATFNLDRKAGLLQVTDYPERLDRVAAYLDAVQDRMQRQTQIDARVLEVTLNDEKSKGIDWLVLTAQLNGEQPAGAPRPAPRPSLTGTRITDLTRFISLLEAQGTVTALSTPRVLTMNNEPAIVRSDVVTLSVTPQISGDSSLTLSVSPIVKGPQVAEADLVARVADGETLVVSGFSTARETRERKTVGTSGGWFGRSTIVTRRRVELVILLTPKIIPGVMAQ